MKLKFVLASLGVSALAISAASSASAFVLPTGPLSVLVGDVDGFGGQVTPGQTGVTIGTSFVGQTASDPRTQDIGTFAQNGGIQGLTGLASVLPITYNFNYLHALSNVTASVEIMTGGMGSLSPWDVVMNGTSIGTISTTLQNTVEKWDFFVDPINLTGNDTLQLVMNTSGNRELIAIDYVRLNIAPIVVDNGPAPIPLPAGMPLMALALSGLGGLALRKRKSA